MSVVDDLQGLEARVASRLRELRPLMDEYRELEQIATRLGLPTDGATGTAPAAASSTPRRARRTRPKKGTAAKRSRGSRAASSSGGRREQVLAAVKSQPGITVREIGVQLGIDPTALYRAVRGLERDREIVKKGRELRPA